MCGTAIEPLLAAAQVTPILPTVDNVYLSGLLARKAGVAVRMSDGGFLASSDVRNLTDPCFASASVTWLTESVEEMNQSHSLIDQEMHKKTTKCFLKGDDGEIQTGPVQVIEMFYKVVDDLFVPMEG